MAETELVLRSNSEQAMIRIVFTSVSAVGPTYPILTITLEARVTSPHEAVVQPDSIKASLSIEGEVISLGEGVMPLSKWYSNHEQRFGLQFHLDDKALHRIQNSLTSDYTNLVLKLTGVGEWSPPSRPSQRGQFGEATLETELSRIDWVNRVLKRTGWGDYFFLAYRVPNLSREQGHQDLSRWLAQMNERFALGDDRGVFPLAYDVVDRIYSQRDNLASKITDTSKRDAMQEVIASVHRFANGGRHRPEERREKGGFEVDRRDAELIRGLTNHLAAYVASL